MKIIVIIEGGVLTGVRCDDPTAEVVLIDFDNAKYEKGGTEKAKKEFAKYSGINWYEAY